MPERRYAFPKLGQLARGDMYHGCSLPARTNGPALRLNVDNPRCFSGA
jgi:hypothetical protein